MVTVVDERHSEVIRIRELKGDVHRGDVTFGMLQGQFKPGGATDIYHPLRGVVALPVGRLQSRLKVDALKLQRTSSSSPRGPSVASISSMSMDLVGVQGCSRLETQQHASLSY